jgi:hypothetical protein
MKALLFVAIAGMEVRLENNVSFFAEASESKEDFINRVTETIDRDYVETLELEEVNAAKYVRQGVKALQKAMPNKTGMEAEMIKDILVERGALTVHPSEDGFVFNSTDGVEDLPTATTATTEEVKPKEKKVKKEKAEKAEKVERVPVEKPSLESIIALAQEKRENVGKVCDFKDFKTGEMVQGLIQAVWIDKRVPTALYRIQELGSLARKNKCVTTEDLVINEEATAEYSDKVVKEKAEKEEAAKVEKAKAKAEKEAVKTEKVKAPKETTEKVVAEQMQD